MSTRLKITLIAISLIVFFVILHYIKKSKLSTQMAVIWVLWSIGLILISIFPEFIIFITSALGIQTTMNGLFIIMVFIVYCLVFYLYLKISILENKLQQLTQHVAIEDQKKDNPSDSNKEKDDHAE